LDCVHPWRAKSATGTFSRSYYYYIVQNPDFMREVLRHDPNTLVTIHEKQAGISWPYTHHKS